MLKKAISVIVLALAVCTMQNVNAEEECSYTKQVELGNAAASVKGVYEEVEIDTGEFTYEVDEDGLMDDEPTIPIIEKGFNVKILNLTPEVMVSVTSSDGRYNSEFFRYNDENKGIIDLGQYAANKVVTYNITAIADGDECRGEQLKTLSIIVPMKNPYYEYEFCKQNPKIQYCSEFIVDEPMSFEQFQRRTAEKTAKILEKEKSAKKNKKGFMEYLKENKKMVIILGSVLVVTGVTTAAIIVIKRRSRLI